MASSSIVNHGSSIRTSTTSRSISSALSLTPKKVRTKTNKGKKLARWTAAEETCLAKHMRDVDTERMLFGDAKAAEIHRRFIADGFNRSISAMANIRHRGRVISLYKKEGDSDEDVGRAVMTTNEEPEEDSKSATNTLGGKLDCATFLFYGSTTDKFSARIRPFVKCGTVGDLFAQACAGGLFGPGDVLVLAARINGAEPVLMIAAGDEDDFGQLVEAMEERGGKGLVEIRAWKDRTDGGENARNANVSEFPDEGGDMSED